MEIISKWIHVMNFLCSRHRRHLALQPLEQQQALCSQWINKAALYYEMEQWHDAASFMGCAFELSCLSLGRNEGIASDKVRYISLTGVYLVSCFRHLKRAEKAEQVLDFALQLLLRQWPKHAQCQAFAESIKSLSAERQLYIAVGNPYSMSHELTQPIHAQSQVVWH